MTDHHARTQAAFRLNLEQQKKRAKDLLKAARAGDAAALARFAAASSDPPTATIQLTDAQRLIARDLGFRSWVELKAHIAALDRARHSVENGRVAPDDDRKTLHLRCGSDIRQTLVAAGFRGDFLEHSYPYAHGPVTATPDHLEREARFIADFAAAHLDVSFESALARRRQEEADLAASSTHYERIVLWMEHDCFDQLVLVRCLAHYAAVAPPVLEIVQTDRFPGSIRFIGLGQLPEEALRLLWERRQSVTRAALDFASTVWRALTLDDPRELVMLMRSGCPDLPYLAHALRRLLQELPAVRSGLSLTERFILEALAAAREPISVSQMFALLTYERDPLPFATDFFLHDAIERLRQASSPLLSRDSAATLWHDRLMITDVGRQVLAGDVDFLSLDPRPRWVGGVESRADRSSWRWNERDNGVTRM
jgi:hypothetical protein